MATMVASGGWRAVAPGRVENDKQVVVDVVGGVEVVTMA